MSPERIRAALLQLPSILQHLFGESTFVVQYGCGSRLHTDLHYVPMSVPWNVLPYFIDDSLAQQITLPGASDLLIASVGDGLSLLFCHESDIHVAGCNDDLLQRFIASPELADIQFSPSAT